MYFREQIEIIMADANLSEADRNVLVEKLTPYVLSYNALSALNDDCIKDILRKIEEAGQLEELQDLLEKKSHFVDDTPTDDIDDGLSMVH